MADGKGPSNKERLGPSMNENKTVGERFKQKVYPGVSFVISKETERITVIIIEKGN